MSAAAFDNGYAMTARFSAMRSPAPRARPAFDRRRIWGRTPVADATMMETGPGATEAPGTADTGDDRHGGRRFPILA